MTVGVPSPASLLVLRGDGRHGNCEWFGSQGNETRDSVPVKEDTKERVSVRRERELSKRCTTTHL